MTCSIQILRKENPVHEVRYVPVDQDKMDKQQRYEDAHREAWLRGKAHGEMERARRAIIQHIAEQELKEEIEDG